MPGTSPREAMRVIIGELPQLPHLAELPGRGPGADLVGRTAALLVDLPVETTATGWRLARASGRDAGRAAGYLSADLDAMEEAADGYAGAFKIQLCGPWTLAASLQLTTSVEPALSDGGAVADLVASLAEAVAAHVADVAKRVPGAALLVQIDEPALAGVLAGSVPTASGLRRVPAVDEALAADNLRAVLAAAVGPVPASPVPANPVPASPVPNGPALTRPGPGDPARTSAVRTMVHCCAAGVPFRCIRRAGAGAVSFDLSVLRRADEDHVGEAAEAGLGIAVGAVPPVEPAPAGPRPAGAVPGGPAGRAPDRAPVTPENAARGTAEAVLGLWRRIGLSTQALPGQVAVTPACGLAGASPARARAMLTQCQAAARLIPELIEETS